MNVANPYAAPTTLQRHTNYQPQSQAAGADTATMYSPGQVAAATFLGGMTAGGILMAINAWQRGRTIGAALSVICGLAATVGLVLLIMMLPMDVPGMLFLGLSTLAMFGIARLVQGSEYAAHLAAGGETAKGWKPVVIALTTALVVGGVMFAIILLDN